jgi:hypothetical protein
MSNKFCTGCDNLLSYRTSDDKGHLEEFCSCGYVGVVKDTCLIVNEYDQKAQDYPIHPNLIYDVTLPRTRQIPCPNPACLAKDSPPEIICFQLNPNDLKVGYLCTQCRTHWK